jgi:hypothetical protein
MHHLSEQACIRTATYYDAAIAIKGDYPELAALFERRGSRWFTMSMVFRGRGLNLLSEKLIDRWLAPLVIDDWRFVQHRWRTLAQTPQQTV